MHTNPTTDTYQCTHFFLHLDFPSVLFPCFIPANMNKYLVFMHIYSHLTMSVKSLKLMETCLSINTSENVEGKPFFY
jgi:hypothetical protein